LEVEHSDIISSDSRDTAVRLPSEVDITQCFAIATSVDLQHLDINPSHLTNLGLITEMPALSHVNLNHNHLCDAGVELLFQALASAAVSVVHVSISSNNVGDIGAKAIAASLPNIPRLTSLELCDNFIQENGSITLAEALGGVTAHEDSDEAAAATGPMSVLSVDLRGNRSRELGAMRWAEVVAAHPTLQFLCLSSNDLGRLSPDAFLGLVYAAVASAALSVLDLRDNFPQGPSQPSTGPPPQHVIDELLADLPSGEFDAAEVKQGVFIRRHRGGASAQKKERDRRPGVPAA
jgi:Leucine-rich repeat (LRR) protein